MNSLLSIDQSVMMFTWLDYAIIIIIAFSAIVSIVRGFVRELLSIVVWLASLWVAWQFSTELAALLTPYIKHQALRYPAAFISLFVVTMILGALVNYLLGQLVDKTGLSGTDRVLGLLFGIVRGVLIVAIFLLIAKLTPLPKEEAWHDSRLIPAFDPLEKWLSSFLPENSKSNFVLRDTI